MYVFYASENGKIVVRELSAIHQEIRTTDGHRLKPRLRSALTLSAAEGLTQINLYCIQTRSVIRPRGKYGNSASLDLRGNTTRATLVALFHYRLGVTQYRVVLQSTFVRAITN